MMQYITIGKDFETQWNALIARKVRDVPSTPFITNNFGIIKWLEVFKDHLTRFIGERNIPLSIDAAVIDLSVNDTQVNDEEVNDDRVND